jgi:hypothetical protein
MSKNRFISSEVKVLNWNRPLAYTLKDDDGGGGGGGGDDRSNMAPTL